MTRARARARTGGQPPLIPSWTVTPENLPPGYVYSGGLRTQVNQDGSIGWAPHNLLWPSANFSGWVALSTSTALGAGTPIAGFATSRMVSGTGGVSGYYKTIGVIPTGQPFVLASYVARVSGIGNILVGTDTGGRSGITVDLSTGTLLSGPPVKGVTPVSGGYLVWGLYYGTNAAVAAICYATATGTTIDAASWCCYGASLQPYLPTVSAQRFEPRTADYSDSRVPVLGPEKVPAGGTFSPAAGWYSDASTISATSVAAYSSTGYVSGDVLFEVGKVYRVSYQVTSVSAGSVRVLLGGVGGIARNAPGVYVENIVAISTAGFFSVQAHAAGFTGAVLRGSITAREVTGHSGAVPRIKIEPASTNLIADGNLPSTWSANSASAIKEVSAVPPPGDGLGTALFRAGDSNLPHFFSPPPFPVVSGQRYTMGVLAKEGGSRFVQIVGTAAAFGNLVWANFDLRNGSIGSSGAGTAAIHPPVPLFDGWWFLAISADCTSNTVATLNVAIVQTLTASRVAAFVGTTESIHIGPGQFELGGAPTSLIPTNGAAVTRTADVLYWPLGTIPGWSTDQGTLVTDAVYGGPFSAAPSVVRVGVAGFGINGGTGVSRWYNGVTNLSATNAPIVVGERVREAASWSGTRRAISSKGSAATSDNAGAFLAAPVPATLTLGAIGAGSQSINGSIGRVDFYPRPATDAQLARLTAPV